MARSIKLGVGNMLFLSCIGSSWHHALRKTLLVVAVMGVGGWAVTGYAENYDWTNPSYGVMSIG
jgi:uncharacterized BrkB/YihY/UPF0761 family membrane protein